MLTIFSSLQLADSIGIVCYNMLVTHGSMLLRTSILVTRNSCQSITFGEWRKSLTILIQNC